MITEKFSVGLQQITTQPMICNYLYGKTNVVLSLYQSIVMLSNLVVKAKPVPVLKLLPGVLLISSRQIENVFKED